MYTKTIKTPLIVQITFIAFFLVMMTPFFAVIASATSLDNYCERQFNLSFRQELLPVAKKCESRFKIIADEWTTWKFTINNK